MTDQNHGHNHVCWIENENQAYCHAGFDEGSLGYDNYLSASQEQVNSWRAWSQSWSTGCDVDSTF